MSAQANDLYYYVNHDSSTEKAIACDKYVREHSGQFLDDMHELNSTYQKKQYNKSRLILERYGITQDNDNLLKNKYISSVFSCSAVYKFSGNINYYRELMKTMTLFISKISYTVNDSLPHYRNVQDLYKQTVNYFDIVVA